LEIWRSKGSHSFFFGFEISFVDWSSEFSTFPITGTLRSRQGRTRAPFSVCSTVNLERDDSGNAEYKFFLVSLLRDEERDYFAKYVLVHSVLLGFDDYS